LISTGFGQSFLINMKFLIGKKKEMTQIFEESGRVIPVTVVSAGPCFVTQIKTKDHDGYEAVQVGYQIRKKGNTKSNLKSKFQFIKEFRSRGSDFEKLSTLKVNDEIAVETFEVGDKINLIGYSKGRGFQGVVKRHGFHGHPATHGHKDQLRMPGSIGSKRTGSVAPGKRMAGHMGDAQVTVKNLPIIKIVPEKNEIYLAGAVPGARNGLVLLTAVGDLKIKKQKVEATVQEQALKESTTEAVSQTEVQE